MKVEKIMTHQLINNDFSDITFGRKSIRAYDETVKISHEEMLAMIQEATTAPSSVNFQPWRFVVVESAEQKDLLKPLVKFNALQNDQINKKVIEEVFNEN